MNAKLNAEFKTIFELNLDPIKAKLMHKESGEGWSLQQASAVELEYRRFLYLMKLFPHEQTAPLFDVDIFWHYHILDTMKYAADCQHIFGYFLHHFPYVGMSGASDEEEHRRVGIRMQELYEATFGEAYIRQDENAMARGLMTWPSQAQNDSRYANAAMSETAGAAWCSQLQSANDHAYLVRPAMGTPITAWCSQIQSANDSSFSMRPASGASITAWCSQLYGANGSSHSVRPASLMAKTAWCSQASRADLAPSSVSATVGIPVTAWCSQAQSANGSAYSMHPGQLLAA